MKKWIIAVSVMLFTGRLWAAVPSLVNIQGRLADPTGVNKPDGTYKLKFTLFDQATGGSQLWTETQTAVPVKNGVFQAFLGQVTSLGTTFNGSGDVYLEIQVENDPAMVPRQRIVSAPLALRAARADALGNDNDVVTVTSDDKVGIGTTSPNSRLQVTDNGASLNFQGVNNEWFLGSNAHWTGSQWNRVDTNLGALNLYHQLGSTDKLRLRMAESGANPVNFFDVATFQADGKMGVGTVNPNATLAISSKDTVTQPALSIRADVNSAYGFDFDHEQVNVGRLDLYAIVNGARTHSMTISRQSGRVGYVGIGTTSPDAKLDIESGNNGDALIITRSDGNPLRLKGGFSASSGYAYWQATRDGYGTYPLLLQPEGNSGVGIHVTDPGSYTLKINGNAYAVSGAWIDGSDNAFKTNVSPMAQNDVLRKILSLRAVTYDLKPGLLGKDDPFATKRQVGVIAQEVESVFPEVVFADRDGLRGVAYGRLTAILIEAIKAQQIQIEALTTKMQELEVKIADLTKK